MKNSFSQLQKQIEALQVEAESARRRELGEVIERIKEAIAAYGLSAADLGLGAARPSTVAKTTRPGARKTNRKSKSKSATVKFRDEAGNTWVGRGPRPLWLRDALKAGKSLDDFAATA